MQVQLATKADRKLVIKAIDDLGRRVTPGDVAAKTGLSVHSATVTLNQVASETSGHLEVAQSGDVAYRFNLGFQNAYLAKGFMRILQTIGDKAYHIAFYLLKISFGIMLILSFIIVVGLILIIMMQRGDRDRDDRGGGIDFSFFDYMILRDLFWWGTSATMQSNQYRNQYGYSNTVNRSRQKSNFLLDCFSFLFGDGNPNYDLEERRWSIIAEAIREHEGVVTSEQLAPYTGSDPKNEDGVLPVLVRFDGRPEVSETGNIVYVFPSLQVSAQKAERISLPAYLKEYPWKFTEAPAEALIPVYLLAGFNFFGSAWLWTNAHRYVELFAMMPLINCLFAYGLFFVGIPLTRFLVISLLNGRIEVRNKRLSEFASRVAQPDTALQAKLAEALQYRTQIKQVPTDHLAYSTEKDLLDQQFQP